MARRKEAERAEARLLRAAGWSLRRIAVHLDVALSSVSVWVRGTQQAQDHVLPTVPSQPPVAHEAGLVLRRCSACEQELPLRSFNRSGNGHQSWCRECFRTYFKRRGALHRAQSHDARRRRQETAKRFVLKYLARHPCVDCGELDPVVLEFDHVRDKRDHVSRMVAQGTSIAALAREFAACEVVCVNCHRRRTARRSGWRRAEEDWRSVPCSHLPQERRNLDIAYAALEASGCVDCGVSELCVLEFDHVSAKRANVTQLARRGCSAERLTEEIKRCVVRCCNCHRRRTAREGGHYRHREPKL